MPPGVPTWRLSWSVISGVAPFWSANAILFASATGSQVFAVWGPGNVVSHAAGAPTADGPPADGHARFTEVVWTTIAGTLVRTEPHAWAACCTTFSRCWPRVVPGFPPTGATG